MRRQPERGSDVRLCGRLAPKVRAEEPASGTLWAGATEVARMLSDLYRTHAVWSETREASLGDVAMLVLHGRSGGEESRHLVAVTSDDDGRITGLRIYGEPLPTSAGA